MSLTTVQSSREGLLRDRIQALGQAQVFAFYEELSEAARARLLGELESVPWEQLPLLVSSVRASPQTGLLSAADLEPVEAQDRGGKEAKEAGEAMLAQGEVAALTVAGGQGTRLGFDGPKGAYPIGPVSSHSFFHLYALSLLGALRRYGKPVPWYVMTSFWNQEATVAYFAANDYFGLDPEQVFFFSQGRMPCFSPEGLLVLADKDRLALAPDGHGGLLNALRSSGALTRLREQGVAHLSCFQIDNAMVRCLDPVFLGMHKLADAQISSKAARKVRDTEGLGNFCWHHGKVVVIEYSDFPLELASARRADGERRYQAGSISVYAIAVSFLESLLDRGVELPWHRAVKRQLQVDPLTGDKREREVIKLERFLFDVLPQADRVLVVTMDRQEEFGPVKTLTGPDSVQSCKQALIERAARWLTQAGAKVSPEAVVEVSPLVASSSEELVGAIEPGRTIEAGEYLYLGGRR